MKEKTACFTGHRELKDDAKVLSKKLTVLCEELIQKGYCYFGAGGARGFDNLAATVILKLKEKYPHIHLILVLPFCNQYEQESGWSKEDICQYQALKKSASKVVHLEKHYSKGCYHRRNRHLADASSVCIAYQYKNSGGTAYTTKYACEKGIPVINVRTRRTKIMPPSEVLARNTDNSRT